MSLARKYLEAHGLRPTTKALTRPVLVKPVKLHVEQPFKLPIVKGEAPAFSLVSIIDRYLFNMDESEKQRIQVKMGGPRSQGVFHPSELCKEDACKRSMAYELYSAPRSRKIDARLKRIFDNGHFVHARLQWIIGEALKKEGGQFSPEIKLPPGVDRVAGTTDGGLVLGGWPYLLEIKSMNKKNYMELGAKPWDEHYDQLNIYMHLSGVRAAFVLVECKDNQDLREYFVRYDVKRWRRVEGVVNEVLAHVMGGVLPDQITSADGCSNQCNFWTICKGAQKGSFKPQPIQFDAPEGTCR